ncbi:MAG: amidophosphoribosyltransferase [Clostridiales bacterium]|nr:amidophosphoribosyltransferase [Clostridiales bacterium]
MGGFFGTVCKQDAISDVFFGTDYHSHLGTRRAGVAAWDNELGLQREIHNIQNSPFRTKFEDLFEEMKGTAAIGCISDSEPQPLLFRSHLGSYAIILIGAINNSEELIEKYLKDGGQYGAMTGGKVNSVEIFAGLINMKDTFHEGIRFAQEQIKGSATCLILTDKGTIIAARDFYGRTPCLIGKNENGFAVAFESFAYKKLEYEDYLELGPAQIVEITQDKVTTLMEKKDKMKICAFLWSYYGYPTSTYEGVNVEAMRCKNGEIMAETDKETGKDKGIDYVCGVPDSGTPHAIGYANKSRVPFARPFIKYTPTWPRSFMPSNQAQRNKVAKMKQIPVHEFIKDKSLLFVDDSIVRGTQLKETVDFLYDNGAKEVHMRSACPPIMYGCKFLSFSRSGTELELIARKTVIELEGEEGLNHLEEYSDSKTERGKKLREAICEKLQFNSLDFQSLEGIIKAIGIDREKLCTYCWSGKE